jgi:cell wall-associated NlpC family hydrolase
MPLSVEQRLRIVQETLSWRGTPYKGHACFKGPHGGVDCGQLIYGVLLNCGHVGHIDLPKDYSLQVSQHRASTEYVDLVSTYMRQISESEVLPADVVVFKLGHAYAHAAIIIDWPERIIHAFGAHGVSAAHGKKTPKFKHAPKLFFTLKDKYC